MLRRTATLLVFTIASIASANRLPAKKLEVRAAQVIAALTHNQEHLIRIFDGPDQLVGAVVENTSKQRDIAWLTPHAEAVMTGPLLGQNGEDLTQAAKLQQGLLLSPLDSLKQASDSTRHSIIVGNSGPQLTVFIDPNCSYCHELYQTLSPEIAGGHVRIRYVLVGTLKDTSAPRAASMLQSKDLAQALTINEKRYDLANEEGGFPIASTIDPSFAAAVTANTALFGEAGMSGTPTILYCEKATRQAQLSPGVPSDIHALISSAGDCTP